MKSLVMRHRLQNQPHTRLRAHGFSLPDLLVVVAVLAVVGAVVLPVLATNRAKTREALCASNLKQVTRAVLMFANDNNDTLPLMGTTSLKETWWWYKDLVKSYAGINGPSSPRDKVFACPNDRGYDELGPFCLSGKFNYGSYNFNGVNLPGLPNIAGRTASSIKEPGKTLLMMEWTAHAPLSWHHSLTGKKNHPFYNDAESVVGFLDGQVRTIPIYYDGVNAAYTRDPIHGYEYKYSGD
jgi:competence protein ComGC